jgi:hypothetical protein
LQTKLFSKPLYSNVINQSSFPEAHAALKAMHGANLTVDFLPILLNAIPKIHLHIYMAETLRKELEHPGSTEDLIPLFETHEDIEDFKIALESIQSRSPS